MPAGGDGQVFISYARTDEDLARALRDRLGEAQISCFMDTGEIRVGDDWRRVTTEALHRAPLLIVVLTARSVRSQEVTFEWAYAQALGVPVVPVIYEAGLELPGALVSLDRLNFTDAAQRQWDRLISRVIETRSNQRITLGLVRQLGIERVLTGRAQMDRRQTVGQLLSRVADGSDLLVVGRSLEAWAREFQALRECIGRRDIRVRVAVVDPALVAANWLVPTDYAQVDLSAAIDKFRKVVESPAPSQGSFRLYFLPNAPVFSFVHLFDSVGPYGLLEFGASLSFDERFTFELRMGESDGLLSSEFKVHDSMISTREPVISFP